jgi:hypothetical protein
MICSTVHKKIHLTLEVRFVLCIELGINLDLDLKLGFGGLLLCRIVILFPH